jgi:hypothetical protein
MEARCIYCEKSGSVRSVLAHAQAKGHEYDCGCGAYVYSEQYLCRHIKRTGHYVSCICGEQYDTFSAAINHARSENHVSVCLCGEQWYTLNNLEEHLEVERHRAKCLQPGCERFFGSAHALQNHQRDKGHRGSKTLEDNGTISVQQAFVPPPQPAPMPPARVAEPRTREAPAPPTEQRQTAPPPIVHAQSADCPCPACSNHSSAHSGQMGNVQADHEGQDASPRPVQADVSLTPNTTLTSLLAALDTAISKAEGIKVEASEIIVVEDTKNVEQVRDDSSEVSTLIESTQVEITENTPHTQSPESTTTLCATEQTQESSLSPDPEIVDETPVMQQHDVPEAHEQGEALQRSLRPFCWNVESEYEGSEEMFTSGVIGYRIGAPGSWR